MANTIVKNDIHLVFHVKSGGVVMRTEDLPEIFNYIGGIIRNMGSIPLEIGGVSDHVHILCSLPKDKCMSDFVRTVKANSSKWMKTLDPYYYAGFKWQTGFGVFSVSCSLLNKTQCYIQNQAIHHKTRSFDDEIRGILDKLHIEYDERYLMGD
jgi:REP element-mobilizing transposase RayT